MTSSSLYSSLVALAALSAPIVYSQSIHANDVAAIASAKALVERVTPAVAKLVDFRLKAGEKGFTVVKNGDGIALSAGDVQQLVAGYGWYLKNIAKVHFSWNGDRLEISIPMPAPKEPLKVENPWKLNFAFNYCTLSYTAAFWDWKRWQREIDFLALHGFTHALVTAGLEKTWVNFLVDQGYPRDKAVKFIPNPAFAAWWNMGNLEGHGGPMSEKLIEQEAKLGKQIVTRMKSLGMTSVLQGYIGFVPDDFERTVKTEGMAIVPQGTWVAGFVRPAVVDPTCAAFPNMAKAWYKALHDVYGTSTSHYGGDLFHEGGTSKGINVTSAAKAVQTAMGEASPNSTWVLQCWGGNPSGDLLKGVKPDKTLVLNLTKNLADGGKHLRTFDGIPWVWCELANFGGNSGMYGGLPLLARLGSDLKDKEASGLIGMGTLSEGVEINPLHYALFFDRMSTKDDIDLGKWLSDYAEQRYGSNNKSVVKALNLLSTSIYSPKKEQEGCTESIVCARPHWGVRKASTWSSGDRYYNLMDVFQAAQLYLNAAKQEPALLKQETFRYDLVDVVRQVLADATYDQLQKIKEAFDSKDIPAYKKNVSIFMDMLKEMDSLLATNSHFLLGTWQARALAKGSTAEEKALMNKSAKMLISTWTGRIDALNDYSNRQWAGLVKDFYTPRWQKFFVAQLEVLTGKKSQSDANQEYNAATQKAETEWCLESKIYPTQEQGDVLKTASAILKKYESLIPLLVANTPQTDGPAWDLKQSEEFSFNVTADVDSVGTYKAALIWTGGSSALKIHSVALYEGDKEMARDIHEGWTGEENKNNTYTLMLKKYRTNLDAYTLKVKVSGASGSDSRGYLSFKKVK